MSNGGDNIIFWDKSQGTDILRKSIVSAKNAIIQEIIEQHSALGKVHPHSLNSIRMLTLIFENKVHMIAVDGETTVINSDGIKKDNWKKVKQNVLIQEFFSKEE